MLEGNDYLSIVKKFLFVAALVDQNTEYKKTAPMTTMRTRYNTTVADVMGDIGQWALGENDLTSLESKFKDLEKILVDAFDAHFESGLNTLKYH